MNANISGTVTTCSCSSVEIFVLSLSLSGSLILDTKSYCFHELRKFGEF